VAREWRHHAVLILLLVICSLYESGNLSYVFSALRQPKAFPSKPFEITSATRTIGTGPLYRDEILSIDGHPFTAARQYYDAVYKAHPGDKLHLVLSEPSGRAVEKQVEIPDQAGNYESASHEALIVCLDVVIPLVCLGLGFAVAFIRPRDRNAWLLLLLLISFSALVGRSEWYSPWPDATFLWGGFWTASWGIWMMLFGISFPNRFALDLRMPWLKYLLLVPGVIAELTFWTIAWVWERDVNAALLVRPLFVDVYFAHTVFQILAVSVFFGAIGAKMRVEAAPDDRRRLRILLTGAEVALFPMAVIAVYSIVRGSDLFAFVAWPLEVAALCVMALFPITLAYVIVVERAMDLRFVIRQSVQYWLARRGLAILRIVLISAFLSTFATSAQHASSANWVPTAGIAVVGIVLLRQGVVTRASTWVDRRFFREAYDAETVLSELAVEAGSYVEIDPLLEKVAQRISDTLHVPDIVILVRDGNVFRTRYSTRMGQPMDIAVGSRILSAPGALVTPLEVYFDKPQPWIRTLSAEEIQTLDYMRSELLLVLGGRGNERGQIIGIMSLGRKKSEVPYSKTDIRLLQAVAVQMGMALENSRLAASLAHETAHREVMNRELEIAREVQERLFPQKFPKVSGVDCFGYCRPARGVGGDYYDFIELPDGRLGIAIGDVSGKGVPAALMMASLQASLRGQAMAGIHDLAELMRNVNKLVYDTSQSNRYATFFYGEFDSATKKLAYVNAGHNPPLILRGDAVIRLDASGPVVGLLPGADYCMEVCQLKPGDIFVGYTDGISEAMNEQDEEWEEDRFIAAAEACAGESAREMTQGIFRDADAFTRSAKQYDDMTLLVMKLAA
jgi:sigma-B regulation protein RsbU (phosphoserine phosphatase)